ncbi:MAG: amidohydrolase family protein [Lentisphaerae bacterium]|nr:amidohydrolase family protein [Lentisphaerota bacterium]
MRTDKISAFATEYLSTGTIQGCGIIDMHGHWGPYGGAYLPCASEEKMLQSAGRHGVVQTVCSSHRALFGDPVMGNREMIEAAQRHPDELAAYYSVNPNYPELSSLAVETVANHRNCVVGYKLLPDYHTYPLTGERYAFALEHANDKNLVVLSHTWGSSNFNSPSMFRKICEKYPGAIFIMGHSGYGEWEQSIQTARDLSNVYLDLTAVWAAHDFAMLPAGSGSPLPLVSCLHVNGIIERMVEQAGSSKIVFGTDMPWYSPSFAAGTVLFARIDDTDKRNILRGNAEKILLQSSRTGK